jgi:hypothetical protein
MNTLHRTAEHEFEAQPGLPEKLPKGEHIVWQGSPDWKALARHVFHVRKLYVYFGLVLLLRMWFTYDTSASLQSALYSLLPVIPLCALVIAAAYGLAYYSAKTCVYTFTTKRVVMRIGIVLSVTYNLPFKQIVAADLNNHGIVGDIALQINKHTRIAYLQLWPHARPWHVRHPQPMLRCLRDAQAVATQLAAAWKTELGGSCMSPSALISSSHHSPSNVRLPSMASAE